MKARDRIAEGESSASSDVAPAAPARRHYPARARDRDARLARLTDANGPAKHKVDAILKDEDRAAYEALLRDAGATNDTLVAWLRARGYHVGERAVGAHRRAFQEMLQDLRRTARFADALGELARAHGATFLPDVALMRLQQLVMQRLMQAGAEGVEERMETKELLELSKVVKEAIASLRQVEALRKAVIGAGRASTSDASGRAAVADRVREILGIPPGDDERALPDADRGFPAEIDHCGVGERIS